VIIAQTLDYSISALPTATSYNWQLSGGGIIQNGQTSTTATINWASIGNFTLSVNGINSCGNGPTQTLNITVGPVTAIVNPDNQYQIKILPNPSRGEFYLTARGLSGKKINIEIINNLGQVINKTE